MWFKQLPFYDELVCMSAITTGEWHKLSNVIGNDENVFTFFVNTIFECFVEWVITQTI